MSRFLVGGIAPYDPCLDSLTASDISYIESLRSEKRRAEVASWRDLLRRALSTTADISYHPSGAPYIVGFDGFISVTHSSSYVAVMISSSPCAIDMECVARDFERVKSRYVSSEEGELMKNEPLLLPLLWSAKEALYKLSPLDGLDFLEDLRVLSIADGAIRATARGCGGVVEMEYAMHDNHVIVHTI